MDNNNSLVPMNMGDQFNKVSQWSRPGGTLAKILTVAAGGMGVYALYLALPVILSMMTNAFYIALLGIAIFALVSIVTNKHFRKLISTAFFMLCRKLTGLIVDIDPVIILQRHIEKLKERVKQISESMGKFAGAIRQIEQEKQKAERDLNRELELLEGYKQAGKLQDATVHSNQAVRLKDLVTDYANSHAKMKLYYDMLKDLQHYTSLKVQDEENEVNVLSKKYEHTRQMYNAFSSMMSIANSDSDDIELYLRASDKIYADINNRLGAMDDVLLSSDSIISQIGVNNAIALNKADALLNVYENYGIEGLFMSEEERKALPASASGTTPVSELTSGWTESDKELLRVKQENDKIVENVRKYI